MYKLVIHVNTHKKAGCKSEELLIDGTYSEAMTILEHEVYGLYTCLHIKSLLPVLKTVIRNKKHEVGQFTSTFEENGQSGQFSIFKVFVHNIKVDNVNVTEIIDISHTLD